MRSVEIPSDANAFYTWLAAFFQSEFDLKLTEYAKLQPMNDIAVQAERSVVYENVIQGINLHGFVLNTILPVIKEFAPKESPFVWEFANAKLEMHLRVTEQWIRRSVQELAKHIPGLMDEDAQFIRSEAAIQTLIPQAIAMGAESTFGRQLKRQGIEFTGFCEELDKHLVVPPGIGKEMVRQREESRQLMANPKATAKPCPPSPTASLIAQAMQEFLVAWPTVDGPLIIRGGHGIGKSSAISEWASAQKFAIEKQNSYDGSSFDARFGVSEVIGDIKRFQKSIDAGEIPGAILLMENWEKREKDIEEIIRAYCGGGNTSGLPPKCGSIIIVSEESIPVIHTQSIDPLEKFETLFGKTATPVSESIAGGHSTASDSSFLVFAAWINGKNRAKATIEKGWEAAWQMYALNWELAAAKPGVKISNFKPWLNVGDNFYLLRLADSWSPGDLCGFMSGNQYIKDADDMLLVSLGDGASSRIAGTLNKGQMDEIDAWMRQGENYRLVNKKK